jgi:molybdopterin molybdotransferase
MAAAAEAGAEVVWDAHGRDDEALLERLIREALERADVLLTSGGVSMGTRDLIKPLLERVAQVRFGRISFKPGKPLTFARGRGGQHIFGLPGFPVSSLITFEVFVRPELLTLGGRSQVWRPRVSAVLEHDIKADPYRLEYQRAVVAWDGQRYLARNTGLQASSRLMSIAGANALLEIGPGDGLLPAGSSVQAFLLADL